MKHRRLLMAALTLALAAALLAGAGPCAALMAAASADAGSPVANQTAFPLKYEHGSGGSGEMAPTNVYDGDLFTFPECAFNALSGKKFDHWKMSGVDGMFQPGKQVQIADNCVQNGFITVTAHWKDVEPAVVTAAPEAIDPAYAGVSQALVTAGQAQNGAMRYAIGADDVTAPTSGWRADIPGETQVGVHYVWYKAVGDDSHGDSEPKCCAAQIKKAALTVTAKPVTIAYGDAPTNDGVTYAGFVNGETEAVLSGALTYDYSYAQYGDAGSYTIAPKGLTADNYDISYASGVLTVKPKSLAGAAVTLDRTRVTYDGKEHSVRVTGVTVDGLSLTANDYTVSGDTKGTEPGTYTVTVAGRGNFADTASAEWRIGKALPEVTPPVARTGLVCTGSPQELVKPGSVKGGKMQYALGDDGSTAPTSGWSASVPTGTDAQTYYVWYMALGDQDHSDTDPAVIPVTIASPEPHPEGLYITPQHPEPIIVHRKLKLTANCTYPDVPLKKAKWKSSNRSVASVNRKGWVTGRKAGTATITLSVLDLTASVEVTVVDPNAVTAVHLAPLPPEPIVAGDKLRLCATFEPEWARPSYVKWKSSDRKVATVWNGRLTARRGGVATITVSVGKVSASVDIEVQDAVEPEGIAFMADTPNALEVRQKLLLAPYVALSPDNARSKLKWRTSDAKVASVRNGKVTGLRKGTATITVTAANDLSASIDIEVKDESMPTGIAFSEGAPSSVAVRGEINLKPFVRLEPDAASSKLIWTTSDRKVAAVKDGKVTGKTPGTARITVSPAKDKRLSATIEVTVTEK